MMLKNGQTYFNPSRAVHCKKSCIEIKINLNFYFHTSLWCLKRFYEGLKKSCFKVCYTHYVLISPFNAFQVFVAILTILTYLQLRGLIRNGLITLNPFP